MPALNVSGLHAGYGDLRILDGVDVSVGDGEYVAVIGPNGAGKSTLLRSVFGLIDVFEGSITFDGGELTEMDTVDVIDAGLGMVPQENNVFPELSVLENLKMGAYTRDRLPDEALAEVYERFPVLEDRLDQPAGELSGGQQQMVAISRALVTDPDLLLLDEPSAGLAPDLVQGLFDEIDAINDRGTAVLVVEQNAEEILRRADRGYILTQGRIRTEDDAEAILADEEIQDRFFGG
jgi:branched-chain amino acid transport system ATP-binding protein